MSSNTYLPTRLTIGAQTQVFNFETSVGNWGTPFLLLLTFLLSFSISWTLRRRQLR